MGEITDFLYKYRSYLIDEETADKILYDQDAAEDFAMEALSKAYGGFTMLPLDDIDTDPFLLTEFYVIRTDADRSGIARRVYLTMLCIPEIAASRTLSALFAVFFAFFFTDEAELAIAAGLKAYSSASALCIDGMAEMPIPKP